MNPAFQIPGLKLGRYRIGDRVRMKTIYQGAIGEIVEDFGPLGKDGKRVYRIKLKLDEWNEETKGFIEDAFEPLDGEAESHHK
jgi:hypothetical protein